MPAAEKRSHPQRPNVPEPPASQKPSCSALGILPLLRARRAHQVLAPTLLGRRSDAQWLGEEP